MNKSTNISILAIALILGVMAAFPSLAEKKQVLGEPYAWTISEPLGTRYKSTLDTLPQNFYRTVVPSARSNAYACTGNYGAEGQNQIFFERPAMSQFFFEDALHTWLPSTANQKFYNTRQPMTLLGYTFGGNKYSNQDHLSALFSGNVNKQLEIGAAMDYIYSKGSYDYQADKDFTVRAFGSYTGYRYELQAFANSYNFLNKENGGITDDRYITDPAEVQGGVTSVDTKSIPTYLTGAHSRIYGTQFYMNHRYKVGYYEVERDSTDSIVSREYIPVTSFIWTMNYKGNKHLFLNDKPSEAKDFFGNTYLNAEGTDDDTRYMALTNTVGIELLEGFNKYAKFGIAGYFTHELRRYTQTTDTVSMAAEPNEALTPFPAGFATAHRYSENVGWAGGQITKMRGSLLTYTVAARFGLLGSAVGDIDVNGNINSKFHMLGDSVSITGYGYFKNEEAPYFTRNYVSNHYIWSNDFGKVRRFRAAGVLNVPHTGTNINAGYETLQNFIYFGDNGLPMQHGDAIHVVSATLKQDLHFKALHWDNNVTYQTSSNSDVLPLPKFSIYSNLYLNFKIGAMKTQFGVDCNYYTKYYAPAYNPATMTFHTQKETECGNFAFMNLYANCKLYKTRFFVQFTHVNQGLFGGSNYFAIPHYPLNPRRFQLGLSVDFAD